MKQFKALLIGSDPGLMQPIPAILGRAGFVVDVISQSKIFQHSNSIAHLIYVSTQEELLETIASNVFSSYDLVVIGDDITLQLIVQSDLPDQTKLKLLPVISSAYYFHLFSKIGLSHALETGHVLTPQFRIAHETSELIPLADTLGYPVVIKIDASFGGHGVFICDSDQDISDLLSKLLRYPNFRLPLLVQKKIEGTTLDLSAFYQDGKLIHFCHATEIKTTYPLGPSYLRTYTQLGILDKELYLELTALGQALGANGFVNLESIWSSVDGRRYFTEADMRPNAWHDYSRYVGNDLATAIKAYFENAQTLEYPQAIETNFPRTLVIPHVSRLKFWELLINRYGVWKFATRQQVIRRIIGHPISMLNSIANRYVQPAVPQSVWMGLLKFSKALKVKLIYLFLS